MNSGSVERTLIVDDLREAFLQELSGILETREGYAGQTHDG